MFIRQMKEEEYPLLEEFLYQAIFVPEGAEMPDRSILQLPELRHYWEQFGQKAGDLAFVAEDEGQVVGAVWVRHIHDYGYIEDEMPSLTISLLDAYRGQGIGSQLLDALLAALRKKKVKGVSLSVSKANPAYFLYHKFGFRTLRENQEDFVMVLDFSKK